MKVIPRPDTKSPVGWLEPDKTVPVLAVNITATEGAKYLIWSNAQQSVALFPASEFEIVDDKLSRRWVASLDANGFIYLAPRGWHVHGFWEDYYGGVPSAERVFEDEMRELLIE